MEIVDVAGNASYKVTPNNLLGFTGGNPVSTSDTQTLTGKTLTAPTLTSPILNGTITGTYTLGGTPTFPAAVVTLTGSQTLTNKILTSPTINAPTITNASISADAVTGFTTANNGTIYGVAVNNGTFNGAAISAGTVGSTQVATGAVVQVVNFQTSTLATGTGLIPIDNTIPQITEGTEFMTLAFTPKSSTNTLIIDVQAQLERNNTGNTIMGLFQDANANALASEFSLVVGGYGHRQLLRHKMTAGTTSSTTFRLRIGSDAVATITFNGAGGTPYLGGTLTSNITVTEVKV